MTDGGLILVAGALLAAGLAASLVATRLRLPGLVLFLGVGMAVGSDGAGWIELDNYQLARRIGIIALVLILFEGGLAAGFAEIRPVLRPAISLALVGTIGTAVVTGLVAAWLFDFSTLEGLLLGSIVAATDSAAIFSLLRGSTLRRKLARTLEGEAGLNDPVAVLLVIGFIDWIQKPDYGLLDMALLFVRQLGIGLAVGLAIGWLSTRVLSRLQLASTGLYPVASICTAALAFGVADVAHGSGFLAVYLVGLALGSTPLPGRQTVAAFHQGMAWVAQIALFLTLGLLVFPSQLGDVAFKGTILALVMAVVARPLSTVVATLFNRYSMAERLVLGWAGLRGAVPVVLAEFPVIAHVPHSQEFFNITFFAVVISTLLQGLTFEPLARSLGATTDEPALPGPLVETGAIRRLGADVVEFPVRSSDAVVGRRVRELGLPRDALLNVIVRGDQALPPRGSTRIEAGDRLHVLLRREVAHHFPELTEKWRNGPWEERVTRRPQLRGGQVIFSTKQWDEREGDPGAPETVGGVRVVEQMRTRHDQPGALVALEDGRFAITGVTVSVGSPQQIQSYGRRRLRLPCPEAEQAWWQEVIGAVART
ncbi:MAG TPA: potassium/proton antiporter [Thermoleophilaceae bacterium]|nr:potassium/proton antiporter [Thermoleophilaceae bacterium]